MKKIIISSLLLTFSLSAFSQKVSDLFTKSETPIYYLGVDFSNVKLIGDFNQFAEAGSVGPILVKEKYFPSWNNLVVKESEKYDIRGMFRKENVTYDLDFVTKLNSETSVENLEDTKTPNYTKENINQFINKYNVKGDGIALVFIAESLNKNTTSGIYHFVAFNMKTKEVLLTESLTGIAGGIGLRNYWGRSIFEVIDQIKERKYKEWKKNYVN